MPSPSLNANNKPGWFPRLTRGIAAIIHPEQFEQEQGGVKMTRYGVVKNVGGKFGEFGNGNQFMIERPSGSNPVDAGRAIGNNKGFVYAAVNAKAREVMTIDWRLFEVNGEDHDEKDQHEILDLLDGVNDNMTGLELKYLTSACLDLTGNAYWFLEGVNSDLDTPTSIHLLPPDRVTPIIDRRSFPYQLKGYRLKLLTYETVFEPYQVLHFRLPNPSDFFSGYSPVMAGAEFIDNDNYAMEFNRKFFVNGARPAGFLESDFVAETQVEALKIGFMDVHGGIDNMNRIGVLPKGVKWTPSGSSPKDMDFSNLSRVMQDRILSMFGVSRTILGTAESDTNRATAETADYVFSKRVVKPHMMLICGFLNEKLIPRYGDNLYISFIDPVPEDKAFRNEEMKTAVASQPVLTANEAREEYMGLGPVDGGDKLMHPTTMAAPGDPQGEGDPNSKPDGDSSAKKTGKPVRKEMKPNRMKAANGARVAFRPARTKLQSLAKKRATMATDLAEKIKAELTERFNRKTKKFESTKEQDEARWKEFSDYTHGAEKHIAEAVRKINGEQKDEVLKNLPEAITKGVNPKDLFDVKHWISITTSAVTPILEDLFEHQADAAAAEVDGDAFDVTEATRAAVKRSVALMAESYQGTTLNVLEAKINDGLQAGDSLADITKTVQEIYEWSDESRAATVAKTESFRTANDALKSAWQQSGVVKTVRWYTSEKENVCPFCQDMDGKTIPINDNFFDNGQSLTVGEGDDAQTMSLDYGDVGAPPLHVSCACFVRPDEISLD